MSRALLDSNIVIDLLAGRDEALAESRLHRELLISVVTWIEVMAGAEAGEEADLKLILSGYDVVPLSPEIAERAASIRRERRLKLPDAVIGATAEVGGLVLVTRNTRDFPPGAPGVRVPYPS